MGLYMQASTDNFSPFVSRMCKLLVLTVLLRLCTLFTCDVISVRTVSFRCSALERGASMKLVVLTTTARNPLANKISPLSGCPMIVYNSLLIYSVYL